MKKPTLKEKIGLLYGQIYEAEKRLDKAQPSERSIIEIGLKAMRGELLRLQRRSDGRR